MNKKKEYNIKLNKEKQKKLTKSEKILIQKVVEIN